MMFENPMDYLGKTMTFRDRRPEMAALFGTETSRVISVIISLPEVNKSPELLFENDPTGYFSLNAIEVLQVVGTEAVFRPLAVVSGF